MGYLLSAGGFRGDRGMSKQWSAGDLARGFGMGTAAGSPPLQEASIPYQVRVHFLRPSFGAAGDVADALIAVCAEKFRDPHAAGAEVAKDENSLIAGNFGEAWWNTAHRNIQAAFDLADRQFVRFAHIQQYGARLFYQSRRFGYVDLNWNIHGSGGQPVHGSRRCKSSSPLTQPDAVKS